VGVASCASRGGQLDRECAEHMQDLQPTEGREDNKGVPAMTTLRLEMGEHREGDSCEHCGAKSRTAHGFVYRNNDAYGIYYAGWSEGHPEQGVSLAIAVGEWSEGSSPADRVSIGVRAVPAASSVDFTVLNPNESPWSDTPLLGRMLERDQALAHPVLNEVMHIAEHIVCDDTRVSRFLGSIDIL
jgi:hypothetical protein